MFLRKIDKVYLDGRIVLFDLMHEINHTPLDMGIIEGDYKVKSIYIKNIESKQKLLAGILLLHRAHKLEHIYDGIIVTQSSELNFYSKSGILGISGKNTVDALKKHANSSKQYIKILNHQVKTPSAQCIDGLLMCDMFCQ